MTIFTTRRTLGLILVCLLGIFLAGIGFLGDKFIVSLLGDDNQAQVESMGHVSGENGNTAPQQKEFAVQDKAQLPIGSLSQENNAGGTSREDDFFADYRLERERVRAQQVEMLNSLIADPNSSAATRQDAQKKLMDITESMERELQLENLIKAKGYTEAAMFIQSGSATAILKKEGMMEEDVAVAADIISRVTGYNLENIVVIPK